VDKYFKERFKALDKLDRGFILTDEFVEVMGGSEAIEEDARIKNILWQINIILEGKISISDFIFILTYTESVRRQESYLRG